MKRFWERLPALAGFGILFAFLSLLFVASAAGRFYGREIPFSAGVLNDPGCYVAGCHMASGSTLNEVGSVSFNNLPERFVPGETYDLGITITGGKSYGFQMAAVFSDGTQAGALTAVTETTIVDEVEGVQILMHAHHLLDGIVDFQWTAPMDPKERRVTLKVASNSANNNGSPTGDAINTLDVSIPAGMVVSAQHKYIFPQFAFGGGWESTLMVQALGSNTTCTFSAQDRSFTMRDPYGNNLSGTQQQLILGMNGGTILKTATPQGMAASSGMAVLDCDEEVSANTLFSLEVGGSLVAEALVESSEEIVSGEPAAQFLADHRDGARFAVAVANPSNQPLDVLIAVGDLGGQPIGEVTVNVPANAAQAFFVDELVTIPTGHTGQVLIRPSNNPGPSVYVVGLRVTGLVITTIPAIVIRPELPTTGLNTSLTDPDGQWTATASAKIIEKNDTYWEFSYFVDMTNRTDEERE